MFDMENESLLRLPQVLKIVPISKSAWWQGCKDGRYPKPIKLGPRTAVWKASDTVEEDEKLPRQAATAGISVARTGKRSILDSDGLEGFQASFYGLTHPPDFENQMLKILQYRVWRVLRDFCVPGHCHAENCEFRLNHCQESWCALVCAIASLTILQFFPPKTQDV